MATTILPKKSTTETPIATDDNHHAALAADSTISQFPVNSTFGSISSPSNSFGSSSFSSGSLGFGSGSSTSMGSVGTGNMNVNSGTQPVLTTAGSNAAQGAEVLVENTNTDWINKKWRPMMGWMYMITCTTDFVIFPVLWSILQALSHGSVTSQWQPLTLQGAGLYHLAMGAVLGIAAYGRTKEKIEGKS